MGAGKSSIGRKVAKMLGRTFTDTDSVVVREHGPIPAIFETHGEAHFRELEHIAVRNAVAGGGVVALGGGAVLDERTRELLKDHDVVYLTVSVRVVAGRISGGGRPLLTGGDPVARWKKIANERRPLYEAVADATFDTSTGRIQSVVGDIAMWAEGRQHD